MTFGIIVSAGLFLITAFMVIVDPYFHYHKELSFLRYTLDQKDERYINDGILKNFDYDAMITGTSMTECFKTSVLDEIFNVKSIKVPLSGGSYKETGKQVDTAIAHNPELKMVIRGLDGVRYFDDKDACDYDESTYPEYLYDDNPFNDAEYVLNKEILVTDAWDVIGKTRTHKASTTFDEYANWNDYYLFGVDGVSQYYERDTVEPLGYQLGISDEEYSTIRANVEQNIISTVAANPDIEFYYFFTPYSIYYWDYMTLLGNRERQIDAEEYMASMMLEYDNLHVFSFYGEYDFICDLNNYKDTHHYGEKASEQILKWMHDGTGELTKDNYEAYYDEIREFYSEYDYEALFSNN